MDVIKLAFLVPHLVKYETNYRTWEKITIKDYKRLVEQELNMSNKDFEKKFSRKIYTCDSDKIFFISIYFF